MATYYKPQSPIQSGEDFIYPITTADQVILSDGSRLEKNGQISIGGGTVKTVSGVAPDSAGNVPLTAAEVGALAVGGTAADSAKLGGKAPEYYLQPRNLLDNSDFTNPVNQRGQTSYTTAHSYGIDRWKVGDAGNMRLTTDGPDGKNLAYTGTGDINGSYIYQRFPTTLKAGRTYTLATEFYFNNGLVSLSSRAIDLGEVEASTTADPSGILVLTFTPSADYTAEDNNTYIRIHASNTVGLRWAALYEGSYTADTLPPYVPKGYAAEMAACNAAPVDLGGGYGGGSLQAYPVGSIYLSTSPTSPASLFGGTWEQMKDRFLLGAGDSYAAGGTGGEATHKLTTSETPTHSHTRGTMEITGTFTTRWDDVSGGGIIFPSRFATGAFSAGNSGETKWYREGQYKTTNSNHNDKLSFTASKNWTGSTSSVGGNGAHNNMPPYLAVYMWKRVR